MIEPSSPFLPATGLAAMLLMCGEPASAASMEVPVPNVTIYPGDTIDQHLLVELAVTMTPGETGPCIRAVMSWSARSRDALCSPASRYR